MIDENRALEKKRKEENKAKKVEEERVRVAEEARKSAMAKYGLKLCNQSVENMFVAYGRVGSSGWETNGWYSVNSGECHTFEKGQEIGGHTYYMHAEGVRGSIWGNGYSLCVDSKNAFTIKGPKDCNSRGYQAVNFHEIKVPDGNHQFQYNFSGGKPSKIDSLSVGDGIYVQGVLSDEPSIIVDMDKANNIVKIRRLEDMSTTWVSADRVITREESQVNNAGRTAVGVGILYCMMNPEGCQKQ